MVSTTRRLHKKTYRKMNKEKFLQEVHNSTLFTTAWSEDVKDGLNCILRIWDDEYKNEITIPQLAYCLATVYFETDMTMQPRSDPEQGRGHRYGTPHPITKQAYYSRGLVPLTWYVNYMKIENVLKQPFLNNPDLVLDKDTAVRVMFEVMQGGIVRGIPLNYFINDTQFSFHKARQVLARYDRAALIAFIADNFYNALEASSTE